MLLCVGTFVCRRDDSSEDLVGDLFSGWEFFSDLIFVLSISELLFYLRSWSSLFFGWFEITDC